jgi:hypothetical protein
MTNEINVLTASFGCSLWPIARQDRRINADIAKRLGLTKKDMVAKKFRINPDRPEWRRIIRIRDAFRQFHYSMTIPYKHGAALLNPLAYDEYQERFDQSKTDFEYAVADFFAALPEIKDEMCARLTKDGECYYSESDYRDLAPESFSFDLLVEPLRHDADFNAFADLIGADKAQELAERLTEENDRAFKASVESVAAGVVDALTHASDRLHNAERWNPSAIEALIELTDLLPVLNITEDPGIETARKELASLFRSFSVDALQDKGNRASTAVEVDRILSKFGNRAI